MEYNTSRNTLEIPEYGRHIQKMVEHCKQIKEKEERSKMAAAIVSVMRQIDGSSKDLEEETHKLWDHLHIISNYELDVDSPYPAPDKDKLQKRPEKIEYPKRDMKFRHYGKSIEGFIKAAKNIEDKEEQKALTETIANMMKKSYLTWNRDSVEDELIVKQLKQLSNGELSTEENFEFENTISIVKRMQTKRTNNNRNNNKNRRNRKRY